MADDDLPPPLEDCGQLLKSREHAQSPYLLNDSSYESIEATKKSKHKKNKAGNMRSLNAGFLLNQNNKKKKSKKKKSKKQQSSREKLEMSSKQNHLLIPEAQRKLNETQGLNLFAALNRQLSVISDVHQYAEAKLGAMTQKLHESKVLESMMNPAFGQAINELATNPQEALKKYQNDPSILPTLTKVVQAMYGKSLHSISKDIHSQIQKQELENIENQQLYDSLKLFKS